MLDKVLGAKLQVWMERVRNELDLPVRLTLWNGISHDLGVFDTPLVSVRINDIGAIGAFLDPSLDTLGEAYVRESMDIDGKVADIVDVAYKLAALSAPPRGGASLAGKLMRKFAHTKSDDKAAIQYHYDVSNDFYRFWLDGKMVYSCGYFEYGLETLDEAQEKKIDLILSKIRLRRGHTLLDIGCGWGALVIRAARRFGTHCVGITLSERQYDLALERVREAQVADLVEIRLQDYRDVTGKFDRITSVGMFEHVGRDNLDEYFSRVQSLLTDNGIALNHGITSTDAESGDSPHGGGSFIDRYVFPAGELPHISLALKTMQSGGLEPLDVENLRRHYVRTLEHWTERFEGRAQAIRAMVGETKYRIWRVYLAGCAHAFAVDNVSIFQIVCQKSRQQAAVIPWSRRYMYR